MFTQYERKIILVGKTGNGKSSLGNVLLGRRGFFEKCSFSAVTKECQLAKKEENASVVDTPGLFDSDVGTSLVENALEIQPALQLCPNPHAFLIVLNGSTRLTEEELLAIDVLRIIFGEQCLKKAILVLTHIENELDQMELNQMFENCMEMRSLIEQCGGRFARIDNKDPRPEHKEDILRLVDEVSKNGTDYYKNEYLNVYNRILLEERLTNLDSKPVHVQIKQLSDRVLQAVEEEKEQRLKELRLKHEEERRLKEEEKEQSLKELRLKYKEELRLKEEEKEQRMKYLKLACVGGVVSVATTGGVVFSGCVQNSQVVGCLAKIFKLDVAGVVPGDVTVVQSVVVQAPQEVAGLVSNVISPGNVAGVVQSVVVQAPQEVAGLVSNVISPRDVAGVVQSVVVQAPQEVAGLVSNVIPPGDVAGVVQRVVVPNQQEVARKVSNAISQLDAAGIFNFLRRNPLYSLWLAILLRNA